LEHSQHSATCSCPEPDESSPCPPPTSWKYILILSPYSIFRSQYGSVTWTLTQTSEQILNTFERKILRRICGPTHERGCWRPRWNNELYSLYKESNIVEDIKIRRLEWAGHIIRMEEERIPKKVLNENFHTTRPVGRPRTRWADVVQKDALQLLGTRGWRRRATNR
jgi:hypothetical protein